MTNRTTTKREIISENNKILKDFKIEYTSHNNGYHYMIPHQNIIIDFYPSTNKIYDKSTGFKGIGISTLLEYMEKIEPEGKHHEF